MQKLLSSLGPVTAVIGAQWGDEGKGKIVDLLAEHFDVIARACGGANAGHTIVVGGKKHVFHLLPAGSLHPGKTVVLGAGMVLHLPTLLEEIRTLQEAGIDVIDRLVISPEAHMLFEYHKEIDAALEKRRTEAKGQGIGTTKRGIGPAYMDKAARSGIRMEDLEKDLSKELQARSPELERMYSIHVDIGKEMQQLKEAASILQGRVRDTVEILHQAKRILIEGAQATLLDLDHGTYPYVTSSATTLVGALQGLGMPWKRVTSAIGVAKAYCTRVGSGDFLMEADPEAAERLRTRGGEYGATTGRPRRCGWLDIKDLKRGKILNGFTHWNITKLDVLDEENVIPVGMGLSGDGKPLIREFRGWRTQTKGIKLFEKLPKEAKEYLSFIEEQTGATVSFIGTGQEREEMVLKH
ncbi:MAG: adenylosuccinate synthase [Candidatus Peregrinibacteria bacterium]